MSGRFRHLARHTFVYGAGSVLQRFVGFLLIPFYTQYLSPADYGVLALAGLLGAAIQQIQLLGLPSALTRNVILTAHGDDDRRAAVGSAGWALLIQSLVMAVLLALFAVPLAGFRGARTRPPWWVKACAASGLAMTALYVCLSILPIIPVGSRTAFALKIVGLIVVTNAIGAALYRSGRRRRRTPACEETA